MKKIKRCLLIFGVFLVVAASTFQSFASLADEGYLWDSEGGFWYIPKSEAADDEITNRRSGPLRAPAASGLGTTIAFPDFDKNKIDVAGFPDYVKAMLASPTSFTVLVVTSNKFYLWVADCCILTVSDVNGRLFIIDLAKTNCLNLTNKYIWPDSKGDFSIAPSTFGCYTAIYSWSASSDLYSLSTPWSVASSSSLARYTADPTPKETDSVLLRYSTRNFSSVTSDAFVFGNNAVYRTNYSSISFPVKAGKFYCYPGTWSECVDHYNYLIISGDSDSNLRLIDGGTFPTAESQQAETQRGILGLLKSLPDKISGFFERLSNALLWFNEEGEASYTNPFDNLLDDIKVKIDDLISDVEGFNDTLTDTLSSVVNYVDQGSGAIQLFLTGVPLISTFLLFFVVFAVVRKVVGR